MGSFNGDMGIFNFQKFIKKHAISPISLGSKGLNNYPKLIILSHYGLKWEYISIFEEKAPKVTEIRKYFYFVKPMPPNVPIWEYFHQFSLKLP